MSLYLPQSPPTRVVTLRVTRRGKSQPQHVNVPNAAVFEFVAEVAARAASLGAAVKIEDMGGGKPETLLESDGDDWPP